MVKLRKTTFFNPLFFVLSFQLFAASQALAGANAGPDQIVNEGDTVVLDGSNSTPRSWITSYSWVQTGGSKKVTLKNASAAQATFIAPSVDPEGTSLTFQLTVTYLFRFFDTDSTIVNVKFVNIPPTADAGPDQSVGEETRVTLDGSNSSDPDEGDGIESYGWSQTAGPHVTLSDDRAVKPTFRAPNVAGSAALTFELTVIDSAGLQDTDTTIVNVTGDNDPPTADAGPDQAQEEEIEVTLNGSNSTDPDDGIESYMWSQIAGPPVTLSYPQVKKPTFEAPNVIGGTSLTFELTVADSAGLNDTDTTIVNVTGDNDPPTADAGPDQTVGEGEAQVQLDGTGSTDPDDGITSYRWSQTDGPQVTLSDPLNVQPTFTPPNVLDNGASLSFELTVTDVGGLESADGAIVNVTGENDPPTANAGADQRMLEKSTVTLDGSHSFDPDDGIVSYQWKQVAGPSVTLSDPTSDKPTFAAPSFSKGDEEPLVFELIVTDSSGLQSSDSTTVSVSDFEKNNPGASGGNCFIATASNHH